MLTLQRASAGSGKTYKLAGEYIRFFITIAPETPDGFGKRRLRTEQELRDSLSHILAITFTNKATNEMQMRIIDKLHALAIFDPANRSIDEIPDRELPDYMKDFTSELNVSMEEVTATCKTALQILLDNYSDFNVSTIDSFFQRVLRTFTYETGISDSYQVELDSDMLARVGVNATLDDMEHDANASSNQWIREIIDNVDSGSWNIFQKKEKKGDNNTTPYGALLDNVRRLENEEFKSVRKEVEEYFRENHNYHALYEQISFRCDNKLRKLFKQAKKDAQILSDKLPDEIKSMKHNQVLGFMSTIAKFANHKGMNAKFGNKVPNLEDKLANAKVQKYLEQNPSIQSALMPLCINAYNSYNEWNNYRKSAEYRLWCLYKLNFPFFGLLESVTRHRQQYLDDNNSIELAETSAILQEIIGEDDAPFIYERLGMLLNHFLIDEFQDTSRMQWQNLKPLIDESMSRGNDNLIIGDAKQSIYRFRNADSSLITTEVPRQYRNALTMLGNDTKENTNWRSKFNIVKFNNDFFTSLVAKISEEVKNNSKGYPRLDFADIYSNVAQTPKHQEPEGYIEARFYNLSKERLQERMQIEIPELIVSMLKRGRELRDIAILIRTNDEGTEIIKTLIEYNRTKAKDDPFIEFVSEDSLRIASASAVKLIESVLLAIAHGTITETTDDATRRTKGVGQWSDIASNFNFFSLGRDDKSTAELMDEFLEEGSKVNRLSEMLANMQTTAIPAIVEATISTFLSEEMKRHDAVFISAFQDIVMEYCESHPTDIGSFLTWWGTKRKSASIASPEEINAVQILTIHKSKGLEYPCVIVPFNRWNMADTVTKSKKEWRWVKPDCSLFGTDLPDEMPPYLPIEITESLEETPHEALLYEYYDAVKSDFLNAAYVAYTRAVDELYILALTTKVEPRTEKDKTGKERKLGIVDRSPIGNYLYDFFVEKNNGQEEILLDNGAKEKIYHIGICKENVEAKKGKEEVNTITLNEYDSHPLKSLKYRMEVLPDIIDPEDYDEDADRDPRSEGNVKHAILELMETVDDLPKAVLAIRTKGLMSAELSERYQKELSDKLKEVEAYKWFDGTKRVIAERPLLRKGSQLSRPDRVMIDDHGNATVVDYKFGKSDHKSAHYKQVQRYVRLLQSTRLYKSVRGYLWYVNCSEVCDVTPEPR